MYGLKKAIIQLLKRTKAMMLVGKQEEWKFIMLREITQTQNDKCFIDYSNI